MKENLFGHLDEDAERIAYLLRGYILNTLTEKEQDELDDWVNADDKNMQLFEEVTDEKNIEANLAWLDKVQSQKSYDALQQAGKFKLLANKFKINRVWMAAASVILLAGTFLIYRFMGNNKKGEGIITTNDTQLPPGGNRATLTLADGSVIDLTAAKNGLIKENLGSDIIKTGDGKLVYDSTGPLSQAAGIHTLSTPVGGQFQVTLPDGTKVWLNAATTLKYPERFANDERKVEVNGEAYFEVTKNEKQPFHVVLADSSGIIVLGTHFNVMAYDNENAKEITLLEGRVKVSRQSHGNGQESAVINPGQQVIISSPKGGGREGALTTHSNVDTEAITGWKDEQFVFHDTPIESILRQVERWYGATVVYKGEIKQLFNATIQRKEPLSKLLHILELNGYVHFNIENKTIYVLP